jgi:hypothetical protein
LNAEENLPVLNTFDLPEKLFQDRKLAGAQHKADRVPPGSCRQPETLLSFSKIPFVGHSGGLANEGEVNAEPPRAAVSSGSPSASFVCTFATNETDQ